MNKQEILDSAVHTLGGKWPNVFNMPTKRTSIDGFYITGCGTITHKDHCEWFKEYEFENRARELGYINGYRWGVEYPTNGMKPDLPDDVVIAIEPSDNECLICGIVCVLNSQGFFSDKNSALKITDERYKPVDTSYLDKPESSLDSEVSCRDSGADWYDYEAQKAVALPPAGAQCEWKGVRGGRWVLCEVIDKFHALEMVVFNTGDYRSNKYEILDLSGVEFRPLDHATRKAEAEKKRVVDAVQQLVHEFDHCAYVSDELLSFLHDKGFLRSPANND